MPEASLAEDDEPVESPDPVQGRTNRCISFRYSLVGTRDVVVTFVLAM